MIFSIGTSNRTASEFFDALLVRGVTEIVDIRSKPTSRFAQFNRPALEAEATRRGVRYSWRGDVLGGGSDQDPDDARVKQALDGLALSSNESSVALVCSEGDPAQCHRVYSIGATLLVRHGIVGLNILRDDTEEPVTATLLRVAAKLIPQAIREEALEASRRAEIPDLLL